LSNNLEIEDHTSPTKVEWWIANIHDYGWVAVLLVQEQFLEEENYEICATIQKAIKAWNKTAQELDIPEIPYTKYSKEVWDYYESTVREFEANPSDAHLILKNIPVMQELLYDHTTQLLKSKTK